MCNRFLLHYPGKNEFIIFISPFLIKSLMPISRAEHCQISASAKLRIKCKFEQHTVDLWQINSLEMENICVWRTFSQPEINPLHNLAKMSLGCEQSSSFVLGEPGYQVPGHCSPFRFFCSPWKLHLHCLVGEGRSLSPFPLSLAAFSPYWNMWGEEFFFSV